MYTSNSLSATPPPTMPLVSPSLIAGLLGVGAVLPLAARSLRTAGNDGAWMTAWAGALGLALLATMRRRWPSWEHPAAGTAWQLAGILGAAVLLRHGADTLLIAVAEAPWSLGPLLGLDLGAWTLLTALLLLCLPAGFLHVLRVVRPGLLAPSLVGLAGVVIVLVWGGGGGPVPRPSLDGDPLGALVIAATLAWTAALVGPAALPLRAVRSLPDRAAPRIVLALAHLALPIALLASAGGARRLLGGSAALSPAGRQAWGRYGGEIGAGVETVVCLLAALLVVVLAARVSARRMPGLRSAVVPIMAAAAGLMAGWLPQGTLLIAALVAGWSAVLLGPEAAPWVPAGRERIGAS